MKLYLFPCVNKKGYQTADPYRLPPWNPDALLR